MKQRGRHMVLCRETKAEGARRDQVTVATQTVFTDLDDAIEYAEGISPSRRPRVVTFVWPEEEHDIYVNEDGAELLYLGETSRKSEGTVVWLLDEDDKRIGMSKTAFERKLRRKT